MNKFLQLPAFEYIKYIIEIGFTCPSGFEDDNKFNYQHPEELIELIELDEHAE